MTDVTIYANQDAHVQEANADTNYGTATELKLKAYADNDMIAFIKFLVSDIPAGATISSAILYLTVTVAKSGGTVETRNVTSTWADSTVTYNTMPTYAASNLHTFSVASAAQINSGADLTAEFSGWYSGSIANYGIALVRTDSANTDARVGSVNNTTQASRPYFVVTYTTSSVSTSPSVSPSASLSPSSSKSPSASPSLSPSSSYSPSRSKSPSVSPSPSPESARYIRRPVVLIRGKR